MVARPCWCHPLGLMLVATVIAAVLYRRTVHAAACDLVAGADAYRQGSYGQPIAPRGALELQQLAITLSDMATEIATRERDCGKSTHPRDAP